jgi:nucleoid DNA-binding protein
MKVVLQDIVDAVAKTTKLARPEAQVVVRRIVKVLVNGLISGQRIEIRNFGVFQTKTVSGRMGRDLNRNLAIALPPYQKVSFKAGKNLRKLFRDLPDEPKVGKNGQLEMPIFSDVPDGTKILAGSVRS